MQLFYLNEMFFLSAPLNCRLTGLTHTRHIVCKSAVKSTCWAEPWPSLHMACSDLTAALSVSVDVCFCCSVHQSSLCPPASFLLMHCSCSQQAAIYPCWVWSLLSHLLSSQFLLLLKSKHPFSIFSCFLLKSHSPRSLQPLACCPFCV